MELSDGGCFPEFDAVLPLDNCTPTVVLNNPVFSTSVVMMLLQRHHNGFFFFLPLIIFVTVALDFCTELSTYISFSI